MPSYPGPSYLVSRRTRALAALLAVAFALTGCGGKEKVGPASSGDAGSPGCGHQAGAASNAVAVSGDFGKQVTVSLAKPLAVSSVERTVVRKGTGAMTSDGDNVNAVVSLFSGKDGKLLDHQAGKVVVGDKRVQESLRAAIECVPIGSRVVTTFPARDLFGDAGSPSAGIAAGDPLVDVVDIVEQAGSADTKKWDDAPSVTFDGRSSPQLTLTGDAPADLELHVIRAGTGQVVGSGDQVTIDYKGLVWRTGKIFDQTYGKGGAPRTFSTNDVVPGFAAALVGQKVGARVIVSIPPSLAYGADGLPDAGITGTDTLVFVIEIAATKAP